MRKIIFKCMQAPGDILMLQLAVDDLHMNYPHQFETDIVSPYPEITFNNPNLTKLIYNGIKDPDAEIIDVNYELELSYCHITGHHFSQGFITDINRKLDLHIKKSDMYPAIYLTEEEKDKKVILKKYNLPEEFWVFNAGIKLDIPLKSWIIEYWIELIRKLSSDVYLVQVGSHNDIHPEFKDVHSLVGKTEDLREFLKVCYCADGSIGPISMHMHIMAAFQKPSVIIAGGRETPTWEMYPIHQFFHTVGMLDCCRDGGCRKSQRDDCVHMVGTQEYPLCMSFITPTQVCETVLKYNDFKDK